MAIVNFQGALRKYVLDDTDVSSIVSQRMYFGRAPQDVTDPYLVFFLIDSVDLDHLNGQTGIITERYQIDSYSIDANTSISLYKAVYNRLKFVAYQELSDYKVYFCHRVNLEDFIEPVNKANEDVFYRYTQDFTVKRNLETT